MAKQWYPVIDYLTCAECGTCVAFCPHLVYDKLKSPSPLVINPNACIDHCHGCGNKCPVGAITYVGDDTGWVPPSGEQQRPQKPCCCGGGKSSEKTTMIEYLYLDLNTCDRCIGTDGVMDEVMETLISTLELAGFHVEYKKTEMTTADIAAQYRFLSSPTIRVNGQDICKVVAESSCGCCSEISGTDVSCRVFEYEREFYEVPPKEMLAKEILKAVFTGDSGCSCGNYELPENLKQFFEGKETKASKCSCGCSGDCE